MSQISRAIVVAEPGPLRESLLSILATIPGVGATAVPDAASAAALLHQIEPALLVVDANPNDSSLWQMLGAAQKMYPDVKHLLLVDSAERQRMVLAAGASVVLLKGFPADGLTAIVRDLLSARSTVPVA